MCECVCDQHMRRIECGVCVSVCVCEISTRDERSVVCVCDPHTRRVECVCVCVCVCV